MSNMKQGIAAAQAQTQQASSSIGQRRVDIYIQSLTEQRNEQANIAARLKAELTLQEELGESLVAKTQELLAMKASAEASYADSLAESRRLQAELTAAQEFIAQQNIRISELELELQETRQSAEDPGFRIPVVAVVTEEQPAPVVEEEEDSSPATHLKQRRVRAR